MGSNSNPALQVARKELEISTARIVAQMGFSHASEVSLDILASIAERFIVNMCNTVHWVAENSGRTHPAFGDIEVACNRMGVDSEEMDEYVKQNRSLSLRSLPRFPAELPAQSKPFRYTRFTRLQPERPEHIPSWAPPIPLIGLPIEPEVAEEQKPATRVPVIPDFGKFNAKTLGLVRSDLSRQSPVSELGTIRKDRPSHGSTSSRPPSRTILLESAIPQPPFKRRLTKRKSQDMDQGCLASNSSSINTTKEPAASSSDKVIYTATDLAKNQGKVMTAVLSGRAAPKDIRTPSASSSLPRLPIRRENLYSSPRDNEQPDRVMQLAVLRHMFTLDSELKQQIDYAFDVISGNRRPPPQPQIPVEPAPPIIARPPCVAPSVNKLVSSGITPLEPLAPLKIKISRSSSSCDPSPVSGCSSAVPSPAIVEGDLKKKSKKKKEKRKRKHSPGPPTPRVETTMEGANIKLKIRFGGPPSNQSSN